MIDGYYQQFVNAALLQAGAPYIWGGKGRLQFRNGQLLKHLFVDKDNNPINVFDCCGLVTHCIYNITTGVLDFRGSHSVKTILDTFPICNEDFGDGCLIIYGSSHPSHVAIDLGRGRVVDAAGGDETTNSLQAALEANARVYVHRQNRPGSTVLGYRRIPLDKSELR